MASVRTKRFLFVMGFLFVLILGAAIYLGYMVSRDVAFDWSNPNIIEANGARGKLKKFHDALDRGDRGYVRLTQLEINSYLMSFRTNFATNIIASESRIPVKLHRVGVDLGKTNNFILYSWAEASVFGLKLPFVLQRGFGIKQEGTNHWEFPQEFIRIGDVEVPPEVWPYMETIIKGTDAPLLATMAWTTNIPGMMVSKNELSERPEFRLYTYTPIPVADFH